jgi:hypothetical protein
MRAWCRRLTQQYEISNQAAWAAWAESLYAAGRRTPHMIERSREKTVVFTRPVALAGVDHPIPAGEYRVRTDEELIEGISFPVYRRVATTIFVPAQRQRGAIESFVIDPAALQTALERDTALDVTP